MYAYVYFMMVYNIYYVYLYQKISIYKRVFVVLDVHECSILEDHEIGS